MNGRKDMAENVTVIQKQRVKKIMLWGYMLAKYKP
mgnify:CR=1 FL=1